MKRKQNQRGGDGHLFVGGQNIHFDATAMDPEEASLDGATFNWSSDLDGPLGVGNPLMLGADSLQDGQHTITVTAQDNQGLMATDDVLINISQVAPAELADLSLDWLLDESVLAIGAATLEVSIRNDGPEAANVVMVKFSLLLENAEEQGSLLGISGPAAWDCTGTVCSTAGSRYYIRTLIRVISCFADDSDIAGWNSWVR